MFVKTITRNILYIGFSSKKKLQFHQKCLKKILNTTQTIQKVTEITLGPYGRNIMIANQMRQQAPRITKDGVTVVKSLQFEDRFDDSISKLVKSSVDYTNKYAGDGTTTSTLLIGQIMKRALKLVSIGVEPKKIRKGLEIGREICLQFIQASKRKISTEQELYNVAMISTNRKHKIASLISDTVFKADQVKIEKSNKSFNSFYLGLKFARGFQSVQLTNGNDGKIVYNYPFILTSDIPITKVKQITKSLQLAKKARKQLLIIAPQISDSIKSTIIYNNKKKIVQAAWLTAPPYGQVGKNLIRKISEETDSFLFGEKFAQKEYLIDYVTFDHFGKCRKLTIDQFQTKIETLINNSETRKNMHATILVGGPNEIQMLQNYDHLIDALNSVKTAKQKGIVAGGGITYWKMADLLFSYEGDYSQGVKILGEALKQPRKKLMQYVPSQKKPLQGQNWEGYDLKQEKIVDMFEAGIIDSAQVAKSVIIDSLSLCNVLVEVSVGISRTDSNISNTSLKALNDKYSI